MTNYRKLVIHTEAVDLNLIPERCSLKITKLTLVTVALLAISATIIVWRPWGGVPYHVIAPSKKDLSLDTDLDYLIAKMKSLGEQLPNEKTFASDVTTECLSLRALFNDSFNSSAKCSVDFILQVHPDSLGKIRKRGFDEILSQSLVSSVVLKNKYDLVAFEGSVFDGFSLDSLGQEILARLKYQLKSPLFKALLDRGLNPRNEADYHKIKPILAGLISSSNQSGRVDKWIKLEKEQKGLFIGGESLLLTTLIHRILTGEIGTPQQQDLIKKIQRLRSAYALAITIKRLRDTQRKRGAVVFGFTHDDDFREFSSSLCLDSKVYNATGAKWQKLK